VPGLCCRVVAVPSWSCVPLPVPPPVTSIHLSKTRSLPSPLLHVQERNAGAENIGKQMEDPAEADAAAVEGSSPTRSMKQHAAILMP
jgi:hypothetical protein